MSQWLPALCSHGTFFSGSKVLVVCGYVFQGWVMFYFTIPVQ